MEQASAGNSRSTNPRLASTGSDAADPDVSIADSRPEDDSQQDSETFADDQNPPDSVPAGPLGLLGEELRADIPIRNSMLADAIGGWRGIIDSSLPSLVFVITYLVTSQNLTVALWSALGAGALIAIWRLLRRQSLQQVLGGFGGVALSAFIAGRTGNAADFFLPGLLINLAYGLAFAVSNLVRWPLVGVAVGAATGDISGWRSDPDLRRAYVIATWSWAGMFGLKLAVQLPLYFAELVGALGIAKIVLGWPLMLLVGLITYRLVKPALSRYHHRQQLADAPAETDSGSDNGV